MVAHATNNVTWFDAVGGGPLAGHRIPWRGPGMPPRGSKVDITIDGLRGVYVWDPITETLVCRYVEQVEAS